MKETIFILLVIAVLLCWTAIKYRRHIVAIIEFYKELKAMSSRLQPDLIRPKIESEHGIQLIKCSRCGKWIPQGEAMGDVSKPVCKAGCELTARSN